MRTAGIMRTASLAIMLCLGCRSAKADLDQIRLGPASQPIIFIADGCSTDSEVSAVPIASAWRTAGKPWSASTNFSYGLEGTMVAGSVNLVTVQRSPNNPTDTFKRCRNAAANLDRLTANFEPPETTSHWTVRYASGADLTATPGDSKRPILMPSPFSSGEIVQNANPGALLLIGAGLVWLGGMLRRKRHDQVAGFEQQ
jgi:hypothetical protein